MERKGMTMPDRAPTGSRVQINRVLDTYEKRRMELLGRFVDTQAQPERCTFRAKIIDVEMGTDYVLLEPNPFTGTGTFWTKLEGR